MNLGGLLKIWMSRPENPLSKPFPSAPLVLIGLFILFWCNDAKSAVNSCDQAAITAADEYGVPVEVLLTITRVETGRTDAQGLSPWPWAVNVEGVGQWFEYESHALAFVFRKFKSGIRNFDIGCFQINYKWHGHAFRSIEEMFDPEINAKYAAHFISKLYDEFGSWPAAAGAFHSRTSNLAQQYSLRFETIRKSLSVDVLPDIGLERSPSDNAKPLIGLAPAHLGSLVTFETTATAHRGSLFINR